MQSKMICDFRKEDVRRKRGKLRKSYSDVATEMTKLKSMTDMQKC